MNLINFLTLLILKCREARKKFRIRRLEKKELNERKKRIKSRFNLNELKQNSQLSLFFPVNRINDSGVSTESKFICGIRRKEISRPSEPPRRIQVEGGPEYRLNDDPRTV